MNQCLAMGLCSGFVLTAAPGKFSLRDWPLQAALGIPVAALVLVLR